MKGRLAMICASCKHENLKKHGHDRHGNQRYRCTLCGVTWIPVRPKLFGDMRIDEKDGILCLRMLLEGNSIRTTERLTGINRNTILRLLETIGNRALRYWDDKMTNLSAQNVECDEIWGFVGCKQKTNNRIHKGYEFGDAYCFTAIERDTKLMVAWHLGKRSPQDAKCFADRLRYVTSGRFQVSTDGYGPYTEAVPNAFDDQVDFAQLIKIYHQPAGPESRYSPAEIAEIHTKMVCGNPAPDLICTSHVERQNLNIRMGIRRMTRLTNAFSKKWENHEAHLAIYFLYYNFCRVHATLKTTPAVKAGLTDRVWSIEKLLNELAGL